MEGVLRLPLVPACWLAVLAVLVWSGTAGAADAPITVEAQTGCPTRPEVVAALELRMPGVTRGGRGASNAYRLSLQRAGGGGGGAAAVTVRLHDTAGALALERELTADGGGGPARPGAAATAQTCQALADAASLVVMRYLREIGYRLPSASPPPDEPTPPPEPPPPAAASPVAPAPVAPAPLDAQVRAPAPPPRLPSPPRPPAPGGGFLGAATGARTGLGGGAIDASGLGGGRGRAELTLALESSGRGWSVTLAGGLASAVSADIPQPAGAGELRLRAYPLRVGFGVPIAVAGGALVPALGVDLDLLSFQASGLADARQGWRLDPSATAGVSYRWSGRGLFLRVSVAGGLALAPRDFDAGGAAPVFRTPNGHLRAHIEMGWWLWKN